MGPIVIKLKEENIMAKQTNAKAVFTAEKATKNTVRFQEVLESEFSAPTIGTIYVPKATLGALGYSEGKKLVVTVTVEGGEK